MLSPLQIGLPGATEFVVILMVSVIMLGIPVAVVVLIVRYFSERSGPDEERIERLEAEVAELRERVDEE